LKFVAPENPLMTKLDLDEEEELADEGIDASKLKKKGREGIETKGSNFFSRKTPGSSSSSRKRQR